MYHIIEDCSPFYVRFTFDGLSNVIDFLVNRQDDVKTAIEFGGYRHTNFDIDTAKQVIEMLPMSKLFTFQLGRVSIFNSPPGGGSGIHKDGSNCRVSFNIPVHVEDDLCTTSWYSDDPFNGMPINGLPYTRSICKFGDAERTLSTLNNPEPIKVMTAMPNEMVLFNTDIYHIWDNTKSLNTRKVLTMRIVNDDDLHFGQVRDILFKK